MCWKTSYFSDGVCQSAQLHYGWILFYSRESLHKLSQWWNFTGVTQSRQWANYFSLVYCTVSIEIGSEPLDTSTELRCCFTMLVVFHFISIHFCCILQRDCFVAYRKNKTRPCTKNWEEAIEIAFVIEKEGGRGREERKWEWITLGKN